MTDTSTEPTSAEPTPAGPMPDEMRAELLARAEADALVELAETCIARLGEPTVLVTPETGLVMLQVREPVCEERFHLGEVVVTRAEVALAGGYGWSVRMGTDRTAALAAAICDAVVDAGHDTDLAADVIDLCHRTRLTAATAARSEWDELRPTEVSFEEMD